MNDFLTTFYDICEEQGWNEDSQLNVLLTFVAATGTGEAFIGFARSVQRGESAE